MYARYVLNDIFVQIKYIKMCIKMCIYAHISHYAHVCMGMVHV